MQTTNDHKHTKRERERQRKKLNLIINLMQYHVSYYLTDVSKPSDIERAYGY